jgi:NADP-dependent 3-hydroxy acid dehydrogenase YdfG
MPLSADTTAIVTGASSGIGEACVRALRDAGVVVHALARRTERLRQLADETGCVAHTFDVRDRDAVMELGASIPADVLINNAGLGRAMGSLWTADLDDIDRTIDTNVTAAILMIRSLLPGMVGRKHGHVVNISSTMAIYPGGAALYGATKGAMHKLSRDLRLELAGSGIRVTEINPGRVSTEFYDVAIDDDAERKRATDHGITELAPADVAESIVHALNAPPHVSINQIELTPTEQVYGGYRFAPLDPG